MTPLNLDLESVKRILRHCDGDGRKLADFDSQTLLWTLSQLVRHIDRTDTPPPLRPVDIVGPGTFRQTTGDES